MTCPGDLELARALSVGAEPALAAHLAACAACRASWDATRSAIELVRELPVALPPPARREEVRTAVLAAGARTTQRRARGRWLAPAILGAATACGVSLLAIARDPQSVVAAAPTPRSPIASEPALSPAASVALVSTSPPAAPAAAASAAVGSPSWPAAAASPRPLPRSARAAAPVAPGPATTPRRAEDAGPAISASSRVAPMAVAPPAVAAAPPAIAVAPPAVAAEPPAVAVAPPAIAPEPPAIAPDELAYDQAWEALRAGDFARAASGFSRVLTLIPDGALAEDAAFWRAVALARGKRSGEALSAFRDFLDGHARSTRAGEASAMLGWLLVGARDYDEASRRFTAALRDANPAVRRSAQAGLDALARRNH